MVAKFRGIYVKNTFVATRLRRNYPRGGGGLPYKESFILGVKTRFGVSYGVEPQMSTAEAFVAPFRVLSRKKYDRRYWAV